MSPRRDRSDDAGRTVLLVLVGVVLTVALLVLADVLSSR